MRIFVTPAKDATGTPKLVRDPSMPHAGHIPAEGAFKDDSSALRRLERSGDVTISTGPAAEGEHHHHSKKK